MSYITLQYTYIYISILGVSYCNVKSEDPDWAPKLGGVVLSPMQRYLLLVAVTAIVLLLWVGGPIFNAAGELGKWHEDMSRNSWTHVVYIYVCIKMINHISFYLKMFIIYDI